MTEKQFAELKALIEGMRSAKPHADTCPHCGHCPHCGRGGGYVAPYNPWYPRPYWTTPYVWTSDGSLVGTTTGGVFGSTAGTYTLAGTTGSTAGPA